VKSPFPGMDPFIEACGLWGDFHNALIAEICRTLCDVLPKGYAARTGKRSCVVLAEAEEKVGCHFEPDVKMTSRGRPSSSAEAGETSAGPGEEAVTLRAFLEEDFTERFIDIYELEPRHLVTSIEVLSPSNKRSGTKGRRRYLRKRQALLLGKANLVEIDLLRGGTRMPMLDPWPKSPIYLLVARAVSAPACRVWPAYLERPLPIVPVPLRKPDPDIPLALQPPIEAIYERGRYAEEIDYTRPLDPPLSARESAWVEQRLRESRPPTEPPKRPRGPRRRG
jgi:hypothetical protein